MKKVLRVLVFTLIIQIGLYGNVTLASYDVLFNDSFDRSNSNSLGLPNVGGQWQTGNENFETYTREDGRVISPAFFGVRANAMANIYQREQSPSVYSPHRAHAYANFEKAVTYPVSISFKFSPTDYERTHHLIGLANSSDGFYGTTQNQSNLDLFLPVNGVGIELLRTDYRNSNSQFVFKVFKDGVMRTYGLHQNIVPFQFESGKFYDVELKIEERGVLIANISDDTNTFSVRQIIPENDYPTSDLDRLIIHDTEAGSLNYYEDLILFDDFVVRSELLTEYPLYTQVKSPYPSEEETEEWADDVYADGNASCGRDISVCGCVISSMVSAAYNAGIEKDVLGEAVTPADINLYLRSVDGYTKYGSLRWLAAAAYFGEFTSDGKIASRLASAPGRPGLEGAMAYIDESLQVTGENMVLAFDQEKSHFVWLPEKTEDSYVVRDPWWYETTSALEIDDTETYVRNYANSFEDARVIRIHDEPILLSGTDIELHLTSKTAELLYTSATGDVVGYADGGVVVNLDNASYGNTEVISINNADIESEGKHLLVYEAGEEFTIDVIGAALGEFELEFFTIDESGETQTFNFSGVTLPGISTSFSFNLETGEVTELPLTYEQFLPILNVSLEGYTEQQKKFFVKKTEKLFERIEEKTVSQAVQSIEVLKKLLFAKKIDEQLLFTALDLLEEDVVQ